jgi:hypothetical protein
MTSNVLIDLFLDIFGKQKNQTRITQTRITKETLELIELLNKIDFEKDYIFNKEPIDKILNCVIKNNHLWYNKYKIFNTRVILKENRTAEPKKIAELQFELYKLIDAIDLIKIKYIAPYTPKTLEEINEMMDELYKHCIMLHEKDESTKRLVEIYDNENAYIFSFSIFCEDHRGFKKMLQNTKILQQ